MEQQANMAKLDAYLLEVLGKSVSSASMDWLHHCRATISEKQDAASLFLHFGAAIRVFADRPLSLSREEAKRANGLRRGFQPGKWTALQAARTALLTCYKPDRADIYLSTLDKLFATADLCEQRHLYMALPLLAWPERLHARAAEGLRSNAVDIFDAIALNNPYPADFLQEAAWNQLVLKAVFLERPLHLIDGLDRRANPKLAQMLVDYACERWAAGRHVMPQLWRLVGPFLSPAYLPEVTRALNKASASERKTAFEALGDRLG
jgi:hypothetical protein